MKQAELWRRLGSVRHLVLAVLVVQLCGAVVGLVIRPVGFLPLDAWYGGAFATPVGFAIGLVVQFLVQPGRLSENLAVVLLLAAASLALPLAGVLLFEPMVSEFGRDGVT